jgi:bacillithiol biosynthesis deacetylase BshB1
MIFPDTPLDLLVVAPHPDDAEISVGGTILTCRQQGLRVGVVELTSGEPTPLGTPEIRTAETAAATRVMDLTWRGNLNLPNRQLVADLDARWKLAEVFRRTRPRIILGPYPTDVHPDHVAASQLVDDARFWAKLSRSDIPGAPYWPPQLFQFWSIHLRIHPKPAFVMDISSVIDRKMEAVRCYSSQLIEERSRAYPTALDDIRDRARYWGWTIHSAFGEPIASQEEIRVTDLRQIGPG